jgi:hypothetical protein
MDIFCNPLIQEALTALEDKQSGDDVVRTSDEVHVRLVLAGNPHTTPAAMHKLAEDPSEKVRSRLAANARLPEDLFKILAKDSSEEVRISVGENQNVPDQVLELLARDTSDDVRLAISANSLLPLHLLKQLAEDDNMFVAESAKKTLAAIDAKADAR